MTFLQFDNFFSYFHGISVPYEYSWHSMTLFYTTFTNVIERHDFTAIFPTFSQEDTMTLQIFHHDFLASIFILCKHLTNSEYILIAHN